MSKKVIQLIEDHANEIKNLKEAMPFEAWQGFGSFEYILNLTEDGFSLTEDGDFMTVEKWKKCFQWWVEQLGGQVQWDTAQPAKKQKKG